MRVQDRRSGRRLQRINAHGTKARLRPQQHHGGLGELKIVVEVRQSGNQWRQDNAFAVGPGGIAFLEREATPREAADEAAENRCNVVEQRTSGIVSMAFGVDSSTAFIAQGGLQTLPVEQVAGVHGPRLQQALFHARQQGRRATAELPNQRNVGRGDTTDPVEYEILFATGQLFQFGGQLFDFIEREFGIEPYVQMRLNVCCGQGVSAIG